MSNTNNQLANLKEQYEQARLLEEHAQWSLDTPRTWEDILFGDNKAAIAADADKWHEIARRIATQMKTLPGGWT